MTWQDTVESTRGRLWLLGCVAPRAVSASLAATRQRAVDPDADTSIPGWQLGMREFGETATDELFIALSAMYREIPTLEGVRASVDACNRVVTHLGGVGATRKTLSNRLAELHGDPPPLQLLGLRRRKTAGIAFEHLEFVSEPRLPQPIVDEGHGAPQVAHARVLRHPGADGAARPWVVFVHGAEQGRFDDLFTFRAKHLHHELGLNVAMPVLPSHGPRRELGVSWPGFDLVGNVATMMRAVSDVRAVIGWIAAGEPGSPRDGGTLADGHRPHPDISVVGMSLGGPVAALVAGLDEHVDAVAATVPMLDAHATIAHHTGKTGGRGKVLAEMLRATPVHAIGGLVDPLAVVPQCSPDRRLVVAALGDRMTSVRSAARLHAVWEGDIHWHPGGHVWHLAAGDVKERLDAFLTSGPAYISASTASRSASSTTPPRTASSTAAR